MADVVINGKAKVEHTDFSIKESEIHKDISSLPYLFFQMYF